ncbi:MAG: CRISPR-associated helicase Cas3' [Bryobacterales bacterium]|nr:CRISPR-associated helicase Cas3' [Bryobacterales bacterium]
MSFGETFDVFFKRATGFGPYEWQRQVALNGLPEVLPVPTGLGKTEGAALAWAWRRLIEKSTDEPLHLVYCLPMRSLVRQTLERLRSFFANLAAPGQFNVGVHELMGGAIDEEWAGKPDRPWILVGTQDQLLSRALNRGYSMSRYEWPVHFGLLNQDCRWIIDEVQLMGPGLWTTSQLDWMRRKRFKSIKPCLTTWMSATMATSFLATTDRETDDCLHVQPPDLQFNDPALQNRRKAVRQLQWAKTDEPQEIARLVSEEHRAGTLSLVICNTVETAREVFLTLPDATPKILLTSRFRRQDREANEARLLKFEDSRRKHAGPIPDHPGLICVSTQVVEAGVDISARHLWSELAPWPSIIQRLGRLNRDGLDNQAKAWFWEMPYAGGKTKKKEARIGPYDSSDLIEAKKLLDALIPLTCQGFAEAIEELEQKHSSALKTALEPKPEPMPRALDLHGLFATERDVHGGFTDVSAFVRSADLDSDLTVFWRDWTGKNNPPPKVKDLDGPDLNPDQEGCAVPAFRLREFLKSQKAAAWTWNDDAEQWERLDRSEVRPGMVVMLHREAGGYDSTVGWTGDPKHRLGDTPRAGLARALRDDARTEIGVWVKLNVHLADTKKSAEEICRILHLDDPYRTAVIEAAALHDIGKTHPMWQNKLPSVTELASGPWAKCPPVLAVDLSEENNDIRDAVRTLRPDCLDLSSESRRRGRDLVVRMRWATSVKLNKGELDTLRRRPEVRWAGHVGFRPGMRHEVASALAMWRRYRDGTASYPALAVYLAAAHHGKVRTVLRSITDTGDDVLGVPRTPSAIDVDGSPWFMDFSVAKDGAEGQWEGDSFLLTGAGWTGLVSDLLGPWRAGDSAHSAVVPDSEPKQLGPFALAYLEALVRAADWRASDKPSQSIGLEEIACEHKPA